MRSRRPPRHPRLADAALAFVAALAAGCTFDPLAGWQPPQFGRVAVGDALAGSDGAVPDVEAPPAPLLIDFIEPDSGLPDGDEGVVIHGSGFASGAEVWFGDARGAFAQTQEGERIFVRTPPHPAGIVDVRVVLPDGREVVRKDGFVFGRPVVVHDIVPAEGPAEGGTPVTVHGEGFLPDTHVLVGGRRLIEQRVVDESLVIGITPGAAAPGQGPAAGGQGGGSVDVIAANLVGSARLKGGFLYRAPVAVAAVEPFAGPAESPATVTVRGSGFTRHAVVRFGGEDAAVVAWGADGGSLRVTVPVAAPGAVDVEVTVPGQGGVRLEDGYVRVPGDGGGELAILAVWPPEGDAAGGDHVALAVSGLSSEGAPRVRFGGAPAALLSQGGSLGVVLVQAPPGDAGRAIDVELQVGARSTLRPAAFRYRPSFRVTAVSPAEGPVGGGAEVSLRGPGLSAGARVWFGPLPATDVRFEDGALVAVTPPGSPGAARVRVEHGDRTATASFDYRWGRMALFALTPDRGAIAGDTYVEVYGADFPATPLVQLDHRLVRDLNRLSSATLAAYTPATSEPASVRVAVLGAGDTAERRRAFTYFDPRGGGPGTWGGPIDGAVNVTVLQSRPQDPVANAFVILDADPETLYRGWTDRNGQVTLSGPGLAGPRDVTATAVGYTAASVIATDAENVILTIIPDVPPSGGGGGGEVLPNGAVSGRVDGIEKYVPVPRAACDDRLDVIAPLCHPCVADADCADPAGSIADPRCSDLGLQGGRCTSGCAESVCPQGFSCAPLDGDPRCIPTLGPVTATCEISRRSPFWSAETAGVSVDTAGYYFLESRLGEVAVVCLGGYEEWDTGAFVPTRMGVKRHVFAESAGLVTEQDMALDIPLTRTVLFRLDPGRPGEGEPAETRVSVFLDFGPDGVIPLAEQAGAATNGDIRLLRVPENFAGSLYDAGLTVYAGRYTPGDLTDVPYSATFRERLDDEDLRRPQLLARGDDGAWALEEVVLSRHPRAVWQAPDGVRLVVGEQGQLVRWTPDVGWTPQPALGDADLNDIDGVDRRAVYVVGDGGAIFRHDGLSWQRMASPTDRDLRGVWAPGPERFIAVGDQRIVEYDQGAWTEWKVAADLNAVSGHHWERAWAVGRDGALLLRTEAGWERVPSPVTADLEGVWLSGEALVGFAVGAAGTLLRLDEGAWERVPLDPIDGGPLARPLLDVHGTGPADVVAVGDGGTLLHFDGRTWTSVGTSLPELTLRSVHGAPNGRWTAVGPRAVPLGPILPVLQFREPEVGRPWNGLHFRWTTGPGARAGALYLDVIGATWGTRWSVLAPGTISGFDLPDLLAAAGFSPVPPGPLRLRAQTAYWPAFDINNVRSSSVSYAQWISWTYHYLILD